MSEVKHTPGPWEWVGSTDLHGGTPPDSVIFCTVLYDYERYAELHCEPADRVLIAAAPDLLAACELLIQQCDESGDFTYGGKLTNKPFFMIRDAIAKAKGETI